MTRLAQIARELDKLEREYTIAKLSLKLDQYKIKGMIDGVGSQSDDEKCDKPPAEKKPAKTQSAIEIEAQPVEAAKIADEFFVSPLVRQVLARFNHLTVDEAIAFAKNVRANGGSMLTHSGVFAATRRRWSSSSRRLAGQFDVIMSWTCCDSIIPDDALTHYVTAVRCRANDEPVNGIYEALYTSGHSCGDICKYPELHKSAPDLKNRNPVGRCNSSTMFHLNDHKSGALTISTSALSINE